MSADSSTKRFKVAAAGAALPPEALRRTATLRVILQYAGHGDWLYAGAVSRHWKDLYREACIAAVQGKRRWKQRRFCSFARTPVSARTFAPTATFYKAAFHSLSRLQWACSFDLQINANSVLPKLAGRFADEQTLLWARSHGLPWTADIAEGAATEGRLCLLKWLSTEQSCPMNEPAVFLAALDRCDIVMLNLLCSTPGVHERIASAWNAVEDDEFSWRAAGGCVRCVSTLQWLQQHQLLEDDLRIIVTECTTCAMKLQ